MVGRTSLARVKLGVERRWRVRISIAAGTLFIHFVKNHDTLWIWNMAARELNRRAQTGGDGGRPWIHTCTHLVRKHIPVAKSRSICQGRGFTVLWDCTDSVPWCSEKQRLSSFSLNGEVTVVAVDKLHKHIII